jgi:hypothetical protein
VTGAEGDDQFNKCMMGAANDVRYKCATREVDTKKSAGRKGKEVGVKAGCWFLWELRGFCFGNRII